MYPYRFDLSVVSGLILLLALAQTVRSHAVMTDARSRGALVTFSISVTDMTNDPTVAKADCPHCQNGGGKAAVMTAANNNWRPWEPLNKKQPFRRDAGLCGDPAKGPFHHMKGGKFGPPKSLPYVKVYKSGQIVEFIVDVTTNHNGFFEFFICNVGGCGNDISEKCFTEGHCRQMMRVKTPECESQKSMECGPIDPNYPGRWIIPCRKGPHVGEHFMGGKFMRYKLPDGFSCKDCVIQWYWATANSCNPPGFIEYFDKYPMKKWGRCPGDGGAFGARNPALAKCGGRTFPEEFWNCADVRVTGNGVGPPSDDPPKVALTPKKFGKVESGNVGNKKTPIVDTTKPSVTPGASPTPSESPAPLKKSFNADKDCKKRLEFSTPNEASPDPVNARCASNWKQCGGMFHKGPTECCDERYTCTAVNKYFAQCKAPSRSGWQKARK